MKRLLKRILLVFLLLATENKITVISENLGYKNSGHFAKLFKEYYGISPKEYRNKNIE